MTSAQPEMTPVQVALDNARKADAEATAALQAAELQVQTLVAKRDAAATELEAARVAQREASAALARGGSDRAFDAAMERVIAAERKLAAFDGEVLADARAVRDAAAAALPSPALIPALELQLRLQAEVQPLYSRVAEIWGELGEVLEQIDRAHMTLRTEHRVAYPTLFPRDPVEAVRDLLVAVPPTVRQFMRHLFDDVGSPYPPPEHRGRTYDPDALTRFADRLNREPTAADLARAGTGVFTPPVPIQSEPRPPFGPARVGGSEVRLPGTPARRS